MERLRMKMRSQTYVNVGVNIWVTSVKEHDSAKYPAFRPVTNLISNAVRVFTEVAIPFVLEKGCWEAIWVAPLAQPLVGAP
jgi:hypothetical protein